MKSQEQCTLQLILKFCKDKGQTVFFSKSTITLDQYF